MYLDTIGEQLRVFLYSCGFGFLLGVLFEVFMFFTFMMPRSRIITFVTDFLYMVTCTFLMFIFGLSVHNGSFKFYVYAGAVIGWFVCYFSSGSFLRKISLAFSGKVKGAFLYFKRGILSVSRKIGEKRAKKLKKSEISSNLLLQDDEAMLYNNEE